MLSDNRRLVSSNLASSSKIIFFRSNTTSGGEGGRLKSSSLKNEKKEIRGANFGSEFVVSFADFLKRDQEDEKERKAEEVCYHQGKEG